MADSDCEPTNTRPQSLAWSQPYHMAPPCLRGAVPPSHLWQVPGGEDPAPRREEAFPELAFLTMGMKTNLGTVDNCPVYNTDWHLPPSSANGAVPSKLPSSSPAAASWRPDRLPKGPMTGPTGRWLVNWGFGGAATARPHRTWQAHSQKTRAQGNAPNRNRTARKIGPILI